MVEGDRELSRYYAGEHGRAEPGAAPPPPPPPPPPLRGNLPAILWRRRWTVLAVAALALAAALVYLRQAAPRYTVRARLYVVEPAGPRLLADGAGAPPNGDTYLNTEAQLLGSIPIVADALRAVDPVTMTTFAGTRDPLAALAERLKVDAGKKDSLITVSLDSYAPAEGERLVGAVVNAYVAHRSWRRHSTAGDVLRLLEEERRKSDAERAAKQQELREFQRANGTLSFEGDRGNLALERLTKLSEQLASAQHQRVEAEATYETARAAAGNPEAILQLIEAQQSKGVQTRDSEYGQLQEELQRLQLQLLVVTERGMLPNYPARQAYEKAVAEVRAQIGEKQVRFARAYLLALSQQCLAARRTEDAVRREFLELQDHAMDLNVKAATYARLKSDLGQFEKASDTLDARIRELRVARDAGPMNVEIVEPARAADRPTWPRKPHILGIAGALGLMGGVCLALWRDARDQRFHSREEIRELLGMPAVHVVPHVGGGDGPAARRARVVQLDPASEAAEACRAVRTSLSLESPSGRRVRSVLVTSPAQGDGKTTLTSNLAIALAGAGHRTLLVDADLRNPGMHAVFGDHCDAGLSSVLGRDRAFADVIRPTDVPNLHFLPGGAIAHNPWELLNGPRFAALLESLAQRYDYVLLDSSPVLAVSDARILAAACDATLLVVRAERSERWMCSQACECLLAAGAEILAVVINDAPPGRAYGAYGRRPYRYGRRRTVPSSIRQSPEASARGASPS